MYLRTLHGLDGSSILLLLQAHTKSTLFDRWCFFWWGCCSFAAWAFCKTVRTTIILAKKQWEQTAAWQALSTGFCQENDWFMICDDRDCGWWRSVRAAAVVNTWSRLVSDGRRYVNLGWACPSYVRQNSIFVLPSVVLSLDYGLRTSFNPEYDVFLHLRTHFSRIGVESSPIPANSEQRAFCYGSKRRSKIQTALRKRKIRMKDPGEKHRRGIIKSHSAKHKQQKQTNNHGCPYCLPR